MKDQRKLKALLFSIGSIVVFVVLCMLLSPFKYIVPEKFERLFHGIIGTAAAIASLWIFIKSEQSTFKEFGLEWEKTTLKKFAIGMLIGVLLSLVMIFAQVLFIGLEVRLSENQDLVYYLIWLPAIVILGFMEEVAFRSYAFIKLNRVFGLWVTQLVIAVLFALYHVSMGWSIGLSFLGPGIWALAYGLAAVASGGISMPTGLHSGVNFILALFVGKLNISSVWTIDFPAEVSQSSIKANEMFGIGMHLCLLILCLIATAIYLRKDKPQLTPLTANRR